MSIFNVDDLGYKPISDYGVIGNLQTVALVGIDGSIDFMCFPYFDSPSIFASLLDRKKGGYFQITSTATDVKYKQLYLTNTNILLTRFLSESGVGEVLDCMPITDKKFHESVVRNVKSIRGENKFRLCCSPKFNYGRSAHQVEVRKGEVIFISKGADKQAFRLIIDVPYEIRDGAVYAEFKLTAGAEKTFIFEEIHGEGDFHSHQHNFNKQVFTDTSEFWINWIGRSNYKGRWRETVNRSALVLKLLTSAKYGSVVAAPTFSLPEVLGGKRNWDYRYTWLRDASFTMFALIKLGFTDEAAQFMHWVEARCNDGGNNGGLQIMYGIDGRKDLQESVLHNFEGYCKSAPVRIGNGAADQLQLDIYGELLDSIYLYNKFGQPISNELWKNVVNIIKWVSKNWQRPDEGIWEIRSGKQEFLYSRMMCWVALDRAIRLAQERSFPAPLSSWFKVRDEIYKDIYRNFWSTQKQSFVQYKHSQAIDASVLIAPMVKFISPVDPMWLSTLRAVERELVSDSLVYRYRLSDETKDGLEGQEGTFCMCSFWYIEVLSRSGFVREAQFYFEKMLGYANHLGLYSEELGPRGEHLGNMPQAFTHLALISAAYHLDYALDTFQK